VVGLLDITKVFHEALAKVERSSSASAQLTAALAGVQSELGGMSTNPQAAAMMAYAEALKDKMALPDLTTVMNTRIPPPMVSARTSVKEAARLMKERRTTAVCVMEGPVGGINSSNSTVGSTVSGTNANANAGGLGTKIAGIFTSKDVVLRVIAAGLDPGRCSVVRVMTPHPDTALPTLSVQDALRKMHSESKARRGVVRRGGGSENDR
jgi:CBS domain-containing protein